jgi:uncharacterized membrane protein YphA (DoxX/SURF4 family)
VNGGRWQRVLATSAPRATIVIRIAVGVVFASEGIQKFLDPDALGAGRFAKIGIPMPEVTGPFVGAVETIGGILVLLGLFTRPAALALVIDMVVAIASTKVPILIGHGYSGFANPTGKTGLWSMLHEARTDLSMLLCCIFLLAVGAGAWSFDSMLHRRRTQTIGGPPT